MKREELAHNWLASEYSRNCIADYKPYSFVDGEGVRCSLYVSGCLFACVGCYNRACQDFSYGQVYNEELADTILQDLAAPYCQGLSLLGGEPFLNTTVCLDIVHRVRDKFTYTKDIWVWSGYLLEDLLTGSRDKQELLANVDILIDGRFVLAEQDFSLQFRGSKNQRIIDVQASLKAGEVILWSKLKV